MRTRLAFAGLVLVLGISLPLLWMTRPWSPTIALGSLQAKQTTLHWQSPDPADIPPSSSSTPTFELVNIGGLPVQIQSIRTSCGCATARAEPELVPPGGRSLIRVSMESLEVGARAATITLGTDSPVSPQINLTLVVEGYRRPPYLFQINADLYYQEGYSADETRKVVVDAITLKGVPPDPPVLSYDTAVLQVAPPTVAERPYIANPEMLVQSYTFPVRFAKPPPQGGLSGEVSVADPWVAGRALRTKLFVEQNRPIRVVPSVLTLYVTEGATIATPVRFLARAKSDGVFLKSVGQGDDSPLVVEPEEKSNNDRFSRFRVSWKPSRQVKEGVYNIVVTTEPGGSGSLIVPVQVRIREG